MKDEEIKKIIAAGLQEGLNLNEIHRLLSSEHEVKMTFMELRLLSAEIEDADWSQFDPKKEETEEEDEASSEPEIQQGTQVEISKIQRPGAMYSGSVTFLSGVKGEWYVDQFGSLGLNMEDETQKPTEEDMQDFQVTLHRMLTGG